MPIITAQTSTLQNQSGSHQFILDDDEVATLADAQAAWDDILAAWPGVSDAGLDNAQVNFVLAGSTPAVAGGNLDEGARVRLVMTTGRGNENYRIPAPAKTAGVFDYITGGAVAIANASVVAFFELFEATGVVRIGENAQRAVSSLKSGYLERK